VGERSWNPNKETSENLNKIHQDSWKQSCEKEGDSLQTLMPGLKEPQKLQENEVSVKNSPKKVPYFFFSRKRLSCLIFTLGFNLVVVENPGMKKLDQ
jgi:hypothetical protein